ncbi:DUF4974 domain-containing protein [Inquilinus sp. KBS0705]|nr:DUF4974 domain-containing protein [Inquilinus sp. KBS0705]
METSRLRLSYLFNCYYNKTATPQERDELFKIIAAGESDKQLSNLIRDAWESLHIDAPLFDAQKTDELLNNILKAESAPININRNNTLFLWLKISAAAAVLVFLGFGAYHFLGDGEQPVQKKIAKAKPVLHDALPGGDKAILTLANGQTITLNNAKNGTLAKQGGAVVSKTADGQLVYNIAGMADAAMPTINTIATPRGGQYQVVLPDGTRVWLNAASTLKFPTRFTGSLRQVEITGEAYFEVTKNAAMPFRVKTSRAQIEVLGTHFNVMDYSDESLMKTTLLEGSVNITTGNATNRLKPGEQAQVNATGNTKVVTDVDVDDEVAWKNGIFQFRDAGIDVILRQASRWYDVDVVYKGQIPKREFTGRIARNVKASELLNMLKYTGVDVGIEGKRIIVN